MTTESCMTFKLNNISLFVPAANVDADVLQTLTREDLKDLFPGPEHFRRRKAIWDMAHPVVSYP